MEGRDLQGTQTPSSYTLPPAPGENISLLAINFSSSYPPHCHLTILFCPRLLIFSSLLTTRYDWHSVRDLKPGRLFLPSGWTLTPWLSRASQSWAFVSARRPAPDIGRSLHCWTKIANVQFESLWSPQQAGSFRWALNTVKPTGAPKWPSPPLERALRVHSCSVP